MQQREPDGTAFTVSRSLILAGMCVTLATAIAIENLTLATRDMSAYYSLRWCGVALAIFAIVLSLSLIGHRRSMWRVAGIAADSIAIWIIGDAVGRGLW